MKNKILFLAFLIYSLIYSQVGIGTDAPSDKAILHVVSPNNNQGVLIPSMTTDQRNNNYFA